MRADTQIKSMLVSVADRWRFLLGKGLRTLGLARAVPGLVSVVIPALEDRADLLGDQALPSVKRQSYSKIEVLIVSERFSPAIAQHAIAFGPECHYFWGVRKSARLLRAGNLAMWCSGAIPSLNFAHRKLRGDFVARLDDDDVWLENHLENALAQLALTNSDFVSSRALDSKGNVLPEAQISDEMFGGVYAWARLNGVVGTPITWVYRRPVSKIPYNPNSWAKRINRPADYDLMLRLAAAGVKMSFSPEITAHQLPRPKAFGLTGSKAFLAEKEGQPSFPAAPASERQD